MKIFLTTVISVSFFLSSLGSYAQLFGDQSETDDIFITIQKSDEKAGSIVIFQDYRINELIYNHRERNKRSEGIPGYRIRIFSNLGPGARDASQEIKARFYELFPEISIHREYDSPYFKVYVGDFRTRIDALKELKRVQKNFPDAFIVPDMINYPDLSE